jgi:hypothetical protein
MMMRSANDARETNATGALMSAKDASSVLRACPKGVWKSRA